MAKRPIGVLDLPVEVNNRKAPMSRFKSLRGIIQIDAEVTRTAVFGPDDTVEFILTTDPLRAAPLVLTCLKACNQTGISNIQICSYYLSALCNVFPGLKTVIIDTLSQIGAEVDIISDDGIGPTGFSLLPNPGKMAAIVLMMSSILILFKNISTVSYLAYMQSRIRALREIVGFSGTTIAADNSPIILEKSAAVIKTMLGSQYDFRAILLKIILAKDSIKDPIGSACGYIASMVEWTDMAPLVFICEVLLLTKSPVIRDQRVVAEVYALSHIFQIISNTEHPQYFRIFHPISGGRLMDRGKYPILLAVAHACKSSRYTSVKNFTAPTGTVTQLVTDLVQMHNDFISVAQPSAIGGAIQKLFAFEAQEDAHEPAAVPEQDAPEV